MSAPAPVTMNRDVVASYWAVPVAPTVPMSARAHGLGNGPGGGGLVASEIETG